LQESSIKGGPPSFEPPVAVPLPDNLGARNVAVSVDGSTAAVELMDLRLATIDLRGEHPPVIFPERWRAINLKSAGTPTGPGRFAISPDGRWVATGFYFGPNDNPRVWDAHTAKVVASPPMQTSLAVFSADGRWLGLSGMGEFQIFSTTDWSCVKKISRDEVSFTHGALAFIGDGGQVACTRTRQQVQLRAAQGDEKFVDLIAPSVQSVSSLRVSQDGNVLAIGSARDVIQVWRLKNIHHALAGMNLDWGAPAAIARAANAGSPALTWLDTHALLTLGGLGFALVTLLSLLALRRHRVTIERFFTAESRAAERNRALEAAKIELMHSQKMQALGTLAAGIAHDFNNLLSVIRMSNKLIGRETRVNADIQENVADIEQAVMQGKSVVSSMLGYARAEDDLAGPADVSSMVEETVSLLSKEFLSGITLTLELDREAPKVNVSRGRLEQVLLNLIVNASEAMQGNGKLKITLHRRTAMPARPYALRPATAENFIEMVVADSGPGIAPENQPRIFEPFFTTKRAATKAGTGLGLSLVYAIAQQDGLGLSVESEPDKGATFTIVIPVRNENEPVRETHSANTPNPP
jgi:signal transduction histidine kinase